MLHPEAIDWRGVIVADPFFLGIEPYALAYNARLGTGGAPDSERHFEADRKNTLTGFASTGSKSVLTGQFVSRGGAFVLWGHIAPHIYGPSVYVHHFSWDGRLTKALHVG